MGEISGQGSDHLRNAQNDINAKSGTEDKPDGYPTDVDGISADDIIKHGKEEFPAFHVTPEEFFSNQQSDRKRMRFKNHSKVGEYMRKTRNYHRPFYIKTQTKDGKSYTRKIR